MQRTAALQPRAPAPDANEAHAPVPSTAAERVVYARML